MARVMKESVLGNPLLSLHGQNKKRAFVGQVKYVDTDVLDIVVHARSLLIQHGPARVGYLDQYIPVLGWKHMLMEKRTKIRAVFVATAKQVSNELVTWTFSRLAYTSRDQDLSSLVQGHFIKLVSITAAVANKFAEGSIIDVNAIETGDVRKAASIVTDGKLTIETLAFNGMLALMPHAPGLAQLTNDVTVTNPLQGILYHYIISSFLCYAVENGFIPQLPGLSTAQGANGGPSECIKAKIGSDKKLSELRKVCLDRGLTFTDYDNFFFQYHPSPGTLRGDQKSSSSGADGEYDSDEASEAAAAEELAVETDDDPPGMRVSEGDTGIAGSKQAASVNAASERPPSHPAVVPGWVAALQCQAGCLRGCAVLRVGS
jgi:hypothetical protein